jgi:probable rRNA maturation factor
MPRSGSSARSRLRPIELQNRHPRLEFDRRRLGQALRTLDRHRPRLNVAHRSVLERASGAEALAVTFVTDEELARLHGAFLQDPTLTDVITFPADPGFGLAGEICVSADAAVRQAGGAARRRGGFARELMLYVVHGWLHLAGHDDRDPRARRHMRRAEARAMAALAAAEALPRFRLRSCRGAQSA